MSEITNEVNGVGWGRHKEITNEVNGGGEGGRHKRSSMYDKELHAQPHVQRRATSAITCTTHQHIKQEVRVPILSILLLSTIGNGTSDTTLHGVCRTIAPGFQMVRPAWILDR